MRACLCFGRPAVAAHSPKAGPFYTQAVHFTVGPKRLGLLWIKLTIDLGNHRDPLSPQCHMWRPAYRSPISRWRCPCVCEHACVRM